MNYRMVLEKWKNIVKGHFYNSKQDKKNRQKPVLIKAFPALNLVTNLPDKKLNPYYIISPV